MTRRLSGTSRLVQFASIAIALIIGVFIVLERFGRDDFPLAEAAPPPLGAGVSDTPSPASTAAEPTDAGPAEAIDLAVAPDGGVPFHPGTDLRATNAYRSPFAMPHPADKPLEPNRVRVGMVLNSIDDYDVKSAKYSADFYLSLTAERPLPALINLQFPNGKVDNKEVLADKPTFKLYRFTGNFKTPPNLRQYPFDAQDLKIVVEDDAHGSDQLRLVADKERTTLTRGFRALGWQVGWLEARALSQQYPERFDGDDLYYSRYVFTLHLERFATSAAFKVFVPAFVIVFIALLGMWVPADEMEVRSNAGAPMLAAAVLFHFSLTQELPATSYLTRADKLMMGVYAALVLAMISTWFMFLVKEENVHKVFVISRWVVPILSVAAMAYACL